MGYQVDHKLSYTGTDPTFQLLLIHYRNKPEDVVAASADKSYLFDGEGVYDEERDEAMLRVSKQFPGILFKVTTTWEQGIGGEVSDNYYKNGKKAHYVAVMTMPEFNPKDLK